MPNSIKNLTAIQFNAVKCPVAVTLWAFVLALPYAHQVHAQAGSEIDLLRIDGVTVLNTGGQGAQVVQQLTDGDTKKAVRLKTKGDAPVELIYDLGAEAVTAHQLVVTSDGDHSGDQPLGIEILASSLSPDTGFQTLRSVQIRKGRFPQKFQFVAQSAQWLMFRLSIDRPSEQVAITEISVRGYKGTPKTTYAFKDSPVDSLKVLTKLKELTSVSLSEDERSLFADAADGKLDDWSFAEAALIASGATQRLEREALLKKLAVVEAGAKVKLAMRPTAFEKGERLLEYLHQTLLYGGYSEQQTDVTKLLTSNSYNCVSSATVFNILGKRCGLDVRGIEVPDHAFSILYDGNQHADIEVTNAKGFNPSRNRRALSAFQQQTGFRYIPDKHPAERREVSDQGMVALIYYNHGVSHAREKEFGDAIVRFFCALSLDPEFKSATKNALSAIGNWSIHLTKEEKWDESLQVINAGIELAPEDASLLYSRKSIWHQRVESTIDAGDNMAAVALLRKANQQVPDGGFLKRQSWIYLKPAQERAKEAKWNEAIEIAVGGLQQVDEPAQEVLTKFITAMFLRLGNAQLDAGDFSGAIATLERGLERFPDEQKIYNNLAYTVQQWYRHQASAGGETEVVTESLDRLIKSYPKIIALQRVAKGSVLQTAKKLIDAGKFEEALQSLDGASLVPIKEIDRMKRSVYDGWANQFLKRNEWKEANKIYEAAVADCPDNSAVRRNAVAVSLNWGIAMIKAKEWQVAVEACRYGHEQYGDYRFKKNLGYVTQEWLADLDKTATAGEVDKVASELVKQFPKLSEVRTSVSNYYLRRTQPHLKEKETDKALEELKRGVIVFQASEMPRDFIRTGSRIYSNKARESLREDQWQEAIQTCETGLREFPKEPTLESTMASAYDAWIDTLETNKEYPAAIKACQKAIEQLPRDISFKLRQSGLKRQLKK